jgi:nucleoside-diphosphate-sugar epimerase
MLRSRDRFVRVPKPPSLRHACKRRGHEKGDDAGSGDRGAGQGRTGEPQYRRADLTDAGQAFAVVRGAEAVIQAAAIPDPLHDPPHVVFQNNVMSVFNVLEAAVRFGVRRFVNISSETVPGYFFPERESLPDHLPVDERHPIRPQDPYALGKHEVFYAAAADNAAGVPLGEGIRSRYGDRIELRLDAEGRAIVRP